MKISRYTANDHIYTITPLDDFEPITGDNLGLGFKVQSEGIEAIPIIRISRTLLSIWEIPNREGARNALIHLGDLKIKESIEKKEDLKYLEFMFTSSDPIVGGTLNLTIEKLRQELEEISALNESSNYDHKRQRLSGLISTTFGIYDEINRVVSQQTNKNAFTTPLSGAIQSNLSTQQIRTIEEYHWALMLTSLPFESMDLSRLDQNFPTQEEQRNVINGIANLAGTKKAYFYTSTIKSLAQAGKLIADLDGVNSPHVAILRAVHGLRNTFPTHTNKQYIQHRKNLGLPDHPPQNGGDDGTSYIDEMIKIYKQLNAALEAVKDKILIICSTD